MAGEWDYKVVDCTALTIKNELNAAGDAKWELVCALSDWARQVIILLFKRARP